RAEPGPRHEIEAGATGPGDRQRHLDPCLPGAGAEERAEEPIEVVRIEHERESLRPGRALDLQVARVNVHLDADRGRGKRKPCVAGLPEEECWLRTLVLERDTESSAGQGLTRGEWVADRCPLRMDHDRQLLSEIRAGTERERPAAAEVNGLGQP